MNFVKDYGIQCKVKTLPFNLTYKLEMAIRVKSVTYAYPKA